MNISSTSFSSAMVQQTQRREPPNAVELTNKVMETSDKNADSLLSIDELNLSEESFSNLDENSDGSISGSELQNSLSSMLENMKNQKTSPEQFGEMLSNMGLEVPPPPQKGGGMPNTSQMANDIFNSKDIDTDGLLTIDELGISKDNFSSLDGDNDGSITKKELEQGLTTLFSSVKSGEMSKNEAGEVLSQLGVEKPQGGGQAQGAGGAGGGSGSSEEEYEDADTNQDGIVSAAEYAAYYGSDDGDMANYTMNLVSTLMDSLKNEAQENKSQNDLDLSKFKQIMTMVNEQTQDKKTSEILDKYISQL